MLRPREMSTDLARRIVARFLQARDTYDTQLAINQILLRSGWEMGVSGKLIKKVRVPLQQSPKVYTLEPLKDGDLVVRDNGGRVTSKVDLSELVSNAQIMGAARRLNDGVQRLVLRASDSEGGEDSLVG
jgi:hypothetical protein